MLNNVIAFNEAKTPISERQEMSIGVYVGLVSKTVPENPAVSVNSHITKWVVSASNIQG
jgi:hypothetical protein